MITKAHVLSHFLQEEHHRATAVPLLRAPAGEHLHRGPEHPGRQPGQPAQGSGCRATGMWWRLTASSGAIDRIDMCLGRDVYILM